MFTDGRWPQTKPLCQDKRRETSYTGDHVANIDARLPNPHGEYESLVVGEGMPTEVLYQISAIKWKNRHFPSLWPLIAAIAEKPKS